jgi:uncharacterized membrane protein YqjE
MKKRHEDNDLQNTYLDIYEQMQENEKKKGRLGFKKKMKKLLVSQVYIGILVVCTLIAIFFDDFRHLVAFKSTDDVFYGITVAVIVFFILGRIDKILFCKG